jgi:tetratricopeptide (TPR) repeat protein
VILLLLAGFFFNSCRSNRAGRKIVSPSAPGQEDVSEIQFGYHFIDGCAQRMKGNLQDALKLFEECRKLQPSNPAVFYELGMLHKLLGNNTAAVQFAKYAAEAEPRNEWYQLLLVDCYTTAGNYPQAIKVREALVKQYPEKPELREELAIAYAVTGQYEKSLRIYEDLERTFGLNEQIVLNKVKLLKSQKKLREAESELIRLSEANKNEARVYGYLAEFYEETNDLEKAKAVYDKILIVDPANPTVNLALHDYYSARGNNVLAFEHLKKAFGNSDLEVQLKSGIVGAFLKRAEAGDSASFRQGTELATMITLVHPESADGYALLGDFSILKENKQDASKFYWLAASRDSHDYRSWENLLFTDSELSRFDSLEKHSSAGMELFPSNARFFLYNGVANIQLRNYKKAGESLQDGLSLTGGDQQLALEFYRLLGDVYFNLGEHVKSDKAFDESLKIDPDNAYVLNNYAYYLSLRKENLERAEKLSQRSLLLKPGEQNFMDTFGWILFQEKKYAEAEVWLSKAVNTGGANATILEHYGDALFMNGKMQDAIRQWQAAKKSGGDAVKLDRKINEKRLNE